MAQPASLRRFGEGFFTWSLACGLSAGAFTVSAATLHVSPQGPITRIADAAQKARDGDVVEIEAGAYIGDVALWQQKKLKIRGVGGPVIVGAAGKSVEGKAIWVIREGEFEVSGITFRGARVADGNGAGIRFEGGHLRVVRCEFRDNQNGILTSNNPQARLEIIDSLFADAPHQTNSLPHLLYVGRIAQVIIRGSRFQQGFVGHLVKSRAAESDLRYNLVYDGPDGHASYEMDFPNGGKVTLVGNIIGQSEHTENPVMVTFGAEGGRAGSTLHMAHNTLLSDAKVAWFLRIWTDKFPDTPKVWARNNLTVGGGAFSMGATGDFDGNYPALASMFPNRSILDFGLMRDSLLRGHAAPLTDEIGRALVPDAEFALPLGTRPLAKPVEWVPGAVQTPVSGG